MTAVLVQTCDIHKTYSSSRPIGVFTNRKALDKCLRQSLRTKRIEIPEINPHEATGSFIARKSGLYIHLYP